MVFRREAGHNNPLNETVNNILTKSRITAVNISVKGGFFGDGENVITSLPTPLRVGERKVLVNYVFVVISTPRTCRSVSIKKGGWWSNSLDTKGILGSAWKVGWLEYRNPAEIQPVKTPTASRAPVCNRDEHTDAHTDSMSKITSETKTDSHKSKKKKDKNKQNQAKNFKEPPVRQGMDWKRKDDMTCLSWNLNGIKSVHKKRRFWETVNRTNPDVMFFTEVRREWGQVKKTIRMLLYGLWEMGYRYVAWNAADKDKQGYSGTAIMSKFPIKKVRMITGNDVADSEGRVIVAEIEKITFLLTYVPTSGFDQKRIKRRREWDEFMASFIPTIDTEHLVWVGDMNLVRTNSDIDTRLRGNPEYVRHPVSEWPGCTDWERCNFENLLKNHSLQDAYEHTKRGKDKKTRFTWYPSQTMRDQGKGTRLDYVLAKSSMLQETETGPTVTNVFHDQGQQGSDHVLVYFMIRRAVNTKTDRGRVTARGVVKVFSRSDHGIDETLEDAMTGSVQVQGNRVTQTVGRPILDKEDWTGIIDGVASDQTSDQGQNEQRSDADDVIQVTSDTTCDDSTWLWERVFGTDAQEMSTGSVILEPTGDPVCSDADFLCTDGLDENMREETGMDGMNTIEQGQTSENREPDPVRLAKVDDIRKGKGRIDTETVAKALFGGPDLPEKERVSNSSNITMGEDKTVENDLELQAVACMLAYTQCQNENSDIEKPETTDRTLFQAWKEGYDVGSEEGKGDWQREKEKQAQNWIATKLQDISESLKQLCRNVRIKNSEIDKHPARASESAILTIAGMRLPKAVPFIDIGLGDEGETRHAMIDSGCTNVVLSRKLLDEVCGSETSASELIKKCTKPGDYRSHTFGNGNTYTDEGTVRLPAVIGGKQVFVNFRVMKGLSHDIIIGGALLKQWGALYDWGEDTLWLSKVPGYENEVVQIKAHFNSKQLQPQQGAAIVAATVTEAEWTANRLKPKFDIRLARSVVIPPGKGVFVGVTVPKRQQDMITEKFCLVQGADHGPCVVPSTVTGLEKRFWSKRRSPKARDKRKRGRLGCLVKILNLGETHWTLRKDDILGTVTPIDIEGLSELEAAKLVKGTGEGGCVMCANRLGSEEICSTTVQTEKEDKVTTQTDERAREDSLTQTRHTCSNCGHECETQDAVVSGIREAKKEEAEARFKAQYREPPEWAKRLRLDSRRRIRGKRGAAGWIDIMTDKEIEEAYKHEPLCRIPFDSTIMTKLSPKEMRILKTIIAINYDMIALDNARPGTSHRLSLDIRCRPGTDSKPIQQHMWRVSPDKRRVMATHVEKMIRAGQASSSDSQFTSNVVLVKKKDGSWRFAVDYRKISKCILYAPWPIPNIQSALDSIGGSKYFSLVDFCSAYMQLPLTEQSKKYTAFQTPDGLFQFDVMPFGLNLCPHEWAKAIDICMGKLRHDCVKIYFDDLLVHSPTYSGHVQGIDKMFCRLREYGFHLKAEKCEFVRKKFTYLGHQVTEQGIQPDPKKVEAIAKIMAADVSTIKKLDSFLGLTGYLRRYIENYQTVAKPLSDLKLLGTKFDGLTQEGKQAFDYLKKKLMSEPILAHPDFTKPFEVHTDGSSKCGLGATLVQMQEGKERVIAYTSRALRPYEKRYFPYKLECAAIIFALEQFRPYLNRKFVLVTDHKALLKLLTTTNNPGGVMDMWLPVIQEYDFDIRHRKGVRHGDADAMSRLKPLQEPGDSDKQRARQERDHSALEITRTVDSEGSVVTSVHTKDMAIGEGRMMRLSQNLEKACERQRQQVLVCEWRAKDTNTQTVRQVVKPRCTGYHAGKCAHSVWPCGICNRAYAARQCMVEYGLQKKGGEGTDIDIPDQVMCKGCFDRQIWHNQPQVQLINMCITGTQEDRTERPCSYSGCREKQQPIPCKGIGCWGYVHPKCQEHFSKKRGGRDRDREVAHPGRVRGFWCRQCINSRVTRHLETEPEDVVSVQTRSMRHQQNEDSDEEQKQETKHEEKNRDADSVDQDMIDIESDNDSEDNIHEENEDQKKKRVWDKAFKTKKWNLLMPQRAVDLDKLDRQTMMQKQLSDEACQKTRNSVIKGKTDRFCILGDGLLVRKKDSVIQVVVPKSLVPMLLTVYHDLPLAGHLGRNKTYKSIKERFWWKNMCADVRDKVRGCLYCQRRKPRRPLRAGLARSVRSKYPFQRIHVDVISKFAQDTDTGVDRMLTGVCAHSGYALAEPVTNESTKTFEDFLVSEVVCRHGVPEVIVTDRAKGFMAKVIKSIGTRLGYKHIPTLGYMPQANAKVERFHAYLATAMTVYTRDKPTWRDRIPMILFAYNTSVHATSGVSPYYVVYGRQPRLPIELLFLDKDNVYKDERLFGLRITENMSDIFREIRQSQFKTQQAMQKYRNEKGKRYAVEFEEGTWVLHWQPEAPPKNMDSFSWIPQKLLNKWSMPCVVRKKIDSEHYLIDDPWRTKSPKVYSAHVTKLIPFHPFGKDAESFLDEITDYYRQKYPGKQDSDSDEEGEDEEGEENSEKNPQDKRNMRLGDLVVIPLNSKKEPFTVARLRKYNKEKGTFLVQWYGNAAHNPKGTIKPGWVDLKDNMPFFETTAKGGRKGEKYYFTNEHDKGKAEVTHDHISHWGIRLTKADRIPHKVLKDISDSKNINWTL